MIYICSVFISLFFTVLISVYMVKTRYFQTGIIDNIIDRKDYSKQEIAGQMNEEEIVVGEKNVDNDEDKGFYKKHHAKIIMCVFFIISFVINYLVYSYTITLKEESNPFLFAKMAIMNGIIACAALTDYKRHKIPNHLIAFGLIARLIIYILEFIFEKGVFFQTLKNDGLGFLLGFVMLFIIAVISKGGIGYGDVKLFGVLGLMAGSGGVFTTIFISLLINSVFALIMIATKKKTLKSALPMAPFIYVGFSIVCIIGLF